MNCAPVDLPWCGESTPHLPKLAASLADCWTSFSLDFDGNAVCVGSIRCWTVTHAIATLHALWQCLHRHICSLSPERKIANAVPSNGIVIVTPMWDRLDCKVHVSRRLRQHLLILYVQPD